MRLKRKDLPAQLAPIESGEIGGENATDLLGTFVEPGVYPVAFVDFDELFLFSRKIWVAEFTVADGRSAGLPLARFYNLPRRGGRPGRSSSLFLDFARIAGRRPPGLLRPPQFLAGCVFSARVVTVEPREGLPETLRYSRIDALLRVEAGAPPILRGSREGANAVARNLRGRRRR
jgi:hypothetical protein